MTIPPLSSTPRADGFRMPAEWEPHAKTWMVWPERPDNWRLGAKPAQAAFATVARAIAAFEPVVVCASAEQMASASAALLANPTKYPIRVVEIGNDVEIGANTTIDRARFGRTVIGEGTKIDNLVQIGHNCAIGKHCLIVALTGISGSTRLGDYVTVAGQVGIAGHIEVGDHAVLAARTGATTSLPGGQFYSGYPAQPFREEMKMNAQVRRLSKLVDRIKAIEKRLEIR